MLRYRTRAGAWVTAAPVEPRPTVLLAARYADPRSVPAKGQIVDTARPDPIPEETR